MAREFMKRRISKEVINLGIGGQIERGGDEMPPRSTVKFQAEGVVSSIKHKFLEDGTVEEMTVLTIVADTFKVLGVKAAAEQDELPLSDPPARADGSPASEPASPFGPLLVSCEACGHERSKHQDLIGNCQTAGCACVGFVPFPASEPAPVMVEETDRVAAAMRLRKADGSVAGAPGS